MKVHLLIIFLYLILTGCTVTNGTQNETVNKAINLQQTIINDPLFEKILTELETSGQIDWSEGRTDYIREKLTSYKSNTDWLLSEYKNKGGFNKDSVFLWRKFNPLSSTTAVTSQCIEKTKLNKWNLNRNEYSILNTLIHERVHSFCQVHPKGKQTREANKCDASYVAGDLAEILISHRMGIKEKVMDKPICPALLQKIEEYKLIVIK